MLTIGTTRFSARETLALSLPIRWARQREAEVAEAEGGARAAAERAEQSLLEARWAIRRGWLALAAAEDREALAAEVVESARRLTGAVRERVEAGRSPRLDLVRAAAEEASQVARAASAAEERRAAWASLAIVLGLDPAVDGRTDGLRPELPGEADLDQLRVAATDAIPLLRAARAEVEAAAAAVVLAERRRLPGLGLELGVDAGDPGLPGPDRSLALAMTLPLGGSGAAAVREAAARQRAAEARLDQASREQATQRDAAFHGAAGARARHQAWASAAEPAAAEAAALTREAWAAGRGDIVRVIEADRALLEARQARVEAYEAAAAAFADLLLATGDRR